MILKDSRDSFAKKDSADRFLGSFDSGLVCFGPSDLDLTAQEQRARGAAAEHRRSRAPRRRSAGVTRKRVPGHGSGSGLVQEHGRGTLNRSRGLAQGQGTAEPRCGGEAGRATPVSHRARCRGKLSGNWAWGGSLPRREGPGRRRGGRTAVQGQIHGSAAA